MTNLSLVFPVVIKALGLAHKTENRGVRLSIKNIDELQVAFDEMGYREYLIEEMIGEVLIELLVGIINDPAHGFVFTIPSGGILPEIFSDSESFVMPFTKSELTTTLHTLKTAKIFSAYR